MRFDWGAVGGVVAWGERGPVRDRGAVLVRALSMRAAGGEACSGIEHLRALPEPFDGAASDSTLCRAVTGPGANGAEVLAGAAAQVRPQMRAGRDRSGPLVNGIGSALVEARSGNKAGAAPHCKGGCGFRPMIRSTADGEPLRIELRPGSAAADSVADRLEALDAAVGVRIGGGGCSAALAAGPAKRSVGFAVSARSAPTIAAATGRCADEPGRWHNSPRRPEQRKRSRAQAADLTDLADLPGRPEGTRPVARREPRRPGEACSTETASAAGGSAPTGKATPPGSAA